MSFIELSKLSNSLINVKSHLLAIDKGGCFDIAKQQLYYIYENNKYKYKASGFQRLCFESPCGNFVIKTPKNYDTLILNDKIDFLSLEMLHNIHEYLCYIEAPEILKPHIAKCELLENGAIKQEKIEVIELKGLYREIGFRKSDKKYVIFDCDCFLDNFDKPKNGYDYSSVFIDNPKLFSKEVVEFAKKLKYENTI